MIKINKQNLFMKNKKLENLIKENNIFKENEIH